MLKFQQLTRTFNHILKLNTTQSPLTNSVYHYSLSTIKNYSELSSDLNIKTVSELDHDHDVNDDHHNDNDLNGNISNDYQRRIKDKYPEYKHVLYSSYLEAKNNDEFIDYYKERKFSKYHRFRKRTDYRKLLENKKKLPENWLEDYEYYDDSLKTHHNENNEEVSNRNSFENLDNLEEFDRNRLGNADITIPSSNVPCNGCGAHLHCNYHKKPGKEIFGKLIFLLNIINTICI